MVQSDVYQEKRLIRKVGNVSECENDDIERQY